MLMLAAQFMPSAETCRNAGHVLLMLNTVAFGGALIAYAIVVVALRRRRIRARAADPYVAPFGDFPNTRSSLLPRGRVIKRDGRVIRVQEVREP